MKPLLRIVGRGGRVCMSGSGIEVLPCVIRQLVCEKALFSEAIALPRPQTAASLCEMSQQSETTRLFCLTVRAKTR